MGDLNKPNICWKDSTAGYKESRRFLKCIGANFLTQVFEKLMRQGGLLGHIVTNKDEVLGNVKVRGSLD